MAFPEPFYRWRPHPWHGLESGPNPPELVTAYIEITPFDPVKYELDKATGYIRVDRPQRSSAQPPSLYGFIPRTFCGQRVAALSDGQAERADRDPLDICVISERPITRSDILLTARVIGGLQMIDDGEADDKIIGVLSNDPFWADCTNIKDMSNVLVERLCHYFSTYKLVPGSENRARVGQPYGVEHAAKVIEASMLDYAQEYGG